MQPDPPEPHKPARLQLWLNAWGFTAAQLERAVFEETRRRISRQNMQRIRRGQGVHQKTMSLIRCGAEKLALRRVGIEELFDFDL